MRVLSMLIAASTMLGAALLAPVSAEAMPVQSVMPGAERADIADSVGYYYRHRPRHHRYVYRHYYRPHYYRPHYWPRHHYRHYRYGY